MPRTNVSIDQSVFEEFSAEAERQHKTIFAFANESMSAIAKISAEGGNAADLYRLWKSVSLLRQIDVITLPSDFIDELIVKLYAVDKPGLLKMFQHLGNELVGILKIAAENIDELEKLAKDFSTILPLKGLKVTKADASTIEIAIVGAGRKIESTECTLEVLKSILNGYGYTPTKTDVNVGTIRIWASKRSSIDG